MVKTICNKDSFILVCDYKGEVVLVEAILCDNIPEADFTQKSHDCSPSIFIKKDTLPEKYNSTEALEELIGAQI